MKVEWTKEQFLAYVETLRLSAIDHIKSMSPKADMDEVVRQHDAELADILAEGRAQLRDLADRVVTHIESRTEGR